MSKVAANVDDALSAHAMSDAAVLDTQAASNSLVEGANVVENLEYYGFDPLSSYVTVLGTGVLGTQSIRSSF